MGERDIVSDNQQRPRVTFGIIVLNGEPFLHYNLRALYPFAHEIIVVEGACVAAASLATKDGHSTDDTLAMLKRFKDEEDPEGKLTLVTGEDDGKPDGFWTEKDEMSQAYARRATGEWLWQVDYDEFYLEQDMETIFGMLQSDPDIAGASFPYIQFWGSFQSVEDGEWFRYKLPCFHRLFRWGEGYRYVKHRPPTVVDDTGRDLHTLRWISHKRMRREGIYLYHYSYVLPRQAEQKVGYFSHVTWSDTFRDNERWLHDRYLELGDPYHVGEGQQYLTWLTPYDGPHPGQIIRMQEDIASGRLKVCLRRTEDIERLLASPFYILARFLLRVFLFVKWHSWKQPARTLRRLMYSMMKRVGLTNIRAKLSLLKRRGWRYRRILGYLDIGGFLYEDQALALYDTVHALPSNRPVVVEIGSWLGKSSLLLAKGIKGKSKPVLYCIDPFNAHVDPAAPETLSRIARSLPRSVLEQFAMNMKRHGVYDIINILVGYSTDFADTFPDSIDLLFIDGNHEYEAVLRDYEDWSKYIKAEGIIALHDVDFDPSGNPTGNEDFVGPGLVAKEKIVSNPSWSEVKLIDNLLLARKVRE